MRSIRLRLVEKRDGGDRLESTTTNHDGSDTVSGRRGTTAPDRHTYSGLHCPATVRSRTTYPVRAKPRDRTRCATVVPGDDRESRTVHPPREPLSRSPPRFRLRGSERFYRGPSFAGRRSRITPHGSLRAVLSGGHGPDATTPCRRTAHPCLDGSPTAVHWRSVASIGGSSIRSTGACERPRVAPTRSYGYPCTLVAFISWPSRGRYVTYVHRV